MAEVAEATQTKAPLPLFNPACDVCTHDETNTILEEHLAGVSDVDLAARFFPGKKDQTARNSLCIHWKKHVPVADIQALLPALRARSKGKPLPVSTQSIFDEGLKDKINAQLVLERMMVLLMERLNLLHDRFMSDHLQGKCDTCGRGPESLEGNVNLAKLLSVIESLRRMNADWIKIRNPKETVKFFFNDTFNRFVQNMMGNYTSMLQEKGRLARQAVNEYAEGKITHQLLLRRITELEDMGANELGIKGIEELRTIQKFIDTEFGKSGWGR